MPHTNDIVRGMHAWYVWRGLLKNCIERVAFRHTTTAVTNTGRAVTATVTPTTTEPVAPSCTVQFSFNRSPVCGPEKMKCGAAKQAIPANLGKGTVTATYLGD